MENNKIKIGRQGEKIAVNYLIKQKYQIITTNYRLGRYEVDIIAKQRKSLIFVEVKTRSKKYFGGAEYAFDFKKSTCLRKAINKYVNNFSPLQQNEYLEIRADFIAVNLDLLTKKADLKHYKNIF